MCRVGRALTAAPTAAPTEYRKELKSKLRWDITFSQNIDVEYRRRKEGRWRTWGLIGEKLQNHIKGCHSLVLLLTGGGC
jgi:hypothetical protein